MWNYGWDYRHAHTHAHDLNSIFDAAWGWNFPCFSWFFAMPDQRQQSIIVIDWPKLRINYANIRILFGKNYNYSWGLFIEKLSSFFALLAKREETQPGFDFAHDSWNNNEEEKHLNDVVRWKNSSLFNRALSPRRGFWRFAFFRIDSQPRFAMESYRNLINYYLR